MRSFEENMPTTVPVMLGFGVTARSAGLFSMLLSL